MSTLLRRASLLVAVYLLTTVGTASANDAWALWLRKDYDAWLESQWLVVAGFKTRQDCMTAMQKRFMEVSGGQPMTTRDTQRGSFFIVASDGTASTAAKCVPDTVGPPRGPKGSR